MILKNRFWVFNGPSIHLETLEPKHVVYGLSVCCCIAEASSTTMGTSHKDSGNRFRVWDWTALKKEGDVLKSIYFQHCSASTAWRTDEFCIKRSLWKYICASVWSGLFLIVVSWYSKILENCRTGPFSKCTK